MFISTADRTLGSEPPFGGGVKRSGLRTRATGLGICEFVNQAGSGALLIPVALEIVGGSLFAAKDADLKSETK